MLRQSDAAGCCGAEAGNGAPQELQNLADSLHWAPQLGQNLGITAGTSGPVAGLPAMETLSQTSRSGERSGPNGRWGPPESGDVG